MKKILFILILLIPFFVYAEYDESKVTIESCVPSYLEGYGTKISNVNIDGNNINVTYEVENVGDKVIFDLVIKNESGEDVELYNREDSTDYVEYILMSPDLDYVVKNNSGKSFQLGVYYVNQVNVSNLVNNTISDNFNYVLDVSDQLGLDDAVHGIEEGGGTHDAVDPTPISTNVPDTVDNPNTKAVKNILAIVCIIFVISIGLFLILRRKSRISKLFIFIGIIGVITPIIVYAYKIVNITFGAKATINKPTVIYPEGKDMVSVEIGDVVKIANEEFYVIGREGEDLVLFAKYNLKVGDSFPSSISGYGLQSSEATGYVSNSDSHKGSIAFTIGSSANWSNYQVYPYNAFNFDSNVYSFVMNYKDYLSNQGVYIKGARLLNYFEALELGCDKDSLKCEDGPDYLTNISYWLGSAKNYNSVWSIDNDGNFNGTIYSDSSKFGIRPVVILGYVKEDPVVDTSKLVCKKAATLHTGTCTADINTNRYGCAKRYGSGSTVTFGSIPNGAPKSGDAYDCDVNNDGVYDSETERFYYVGSERDESRLIYYRNTDDNKYVYDSSGENWHGPRNAYEQLPSISEWSNPGLVRPGSLLIKNNEGDAYTNKLRNRTELFTYTDRAASMPRAQDFIKSCSAIDYLSDGGEKLKYCNSFLDSVPSYLTGSGVVGYWLETPSSRLDNFVWAVAGYSTSLTDLLGPVDVDYNYGVRPVITVKTVTIEQ